MEDRVECAVFFSYSQSAAWALDAPKARRGVSSDEVTASRDSVLNRDRINVTIVDKDGDKHDFQVAEGDNLLDIAQANDLEMEGSHSQ